MQDPHAPFAITRNQRSLDGSLRLPRRPCADASLDRRVSESEFHKHLSFDITFVGKYTTFFQNVSFSLIIISLCMKYKLKL